MAKKLSSEVEYLNMGGRNLLGEIKNPKYEREFETNRTISDTIFTIKFELESWIYDRRRVL